MELCISAAERALIWQELMIGMPVWESVCATENTRSSVRLILTEFIAMKETQTDES